MEMDDDGCSTMPPDGVGHRGGGPASMDDADRLSMILCAMADIEFGAKDSDTIYRRLVAGPSLWAQQARRL